MALIFVGGPIQNAIGPLGLDVDLKVVVLRMLKLLQNGKHITISAFQEGYLDDFENNLSRVYLPPSEACRRDYENVIRCDAYVCLWPNSSSGIPIRSDGMCVELGWATASRKPCFLVRDTDARQSDIIAGLASIAIVHHISFSEFQSAPQVLLERLNAVLKEY